MQAAEEAGRVTSYERHDRAAGVMHRFRFVNNVPLNESRADVRVNFIEYWEIGQDKGQLRLKDEMGLFLTRQPVMSNRESLCKRRAKGWSDHSLSCPLP